MLSLPSLAPQDSYTLWYTSSSSTNSSHHHTEPNASDPFTTTPHNQNTQSHLHRRTHAIQRHPLARLRQDEEYIERRKQNIQNYGNSWIKPPGIPKSLYQLREEKREMEEHQEALRREQLAQELAEAEANDVDELLHGEGMDGEVGEEGRDLDDDVPEADNTHLAFEDGDADETDEDEEEEIEEVPRGVLASRMPDDVYREALVRGEGARVAQFGEEGDSTIDGEDGEGMLQEEDLVHEAGMMGDEDMDMDQDLDADIPEDDEGYEHTDTDDEISSSEEEDSVDDDALPQRHFQTATSMVRSDGTQNSLDFSSMLSHESSQFGSSPQPRASRRLDPRC